MSNLLKDHRTQECEKEFESIMHLNQLANKLSDSFNNTTNVTKSYIHVANAPTCLDRSAIQITPMKKGHGKDLQSCK